MPFTVLQCVNTNIIYLFIYIYNALELGYLSYPDKIMN